MNKGIVMSSYFKNICFIFEYFEHLLVEVFNTLLIGGNAVMRSLHPRKDKVRHLPSAESNSSRELDFNIVRLLKNVVKGKN